VAEESTLAALARYIESLVSPRSAEAVVRPLDERAEAVHQAALAGAPVGAAVPAPLVPGEVPTTLLDAMARYVRGQRVSGGSGYPYMADAGAPLDPFKQMLYQAIAQKAEADPREVTVGYGMRGDTEDLANYDPRAQSIVLSSGELGHLPVSDPRVQGAYGHELLHFLLKAGGGYPYAEHPLIRYILGTDVGNSLSPRLEMAARPFLPANHPVAAAQALQQQILDNPADPRAPRVNLEYTAREQMAPAVLEALRRLFEGTPLQEGVWQRER
jgi:hypothetical protein